MKPFRLTGTARRRELWGALVALAALAGLAAVLESHGTLWPWARYAAAVAVPAFAAVLATGVRRLHDIARPGSWMLLWLVPPLGALLVLWLLVAPPRSRKHGSSAAGVLVGGAVMAALLLVALLRLVVQPVWITDGAMKPALLPGDVALLRYIDADDVARGDIVAFRDPLDGGLRALRVLGLPGDTVQMRGGRVLLNGAELPQSPAGSFVETMGPQGPGHLRPRCEGGPVGDGGTCRKSQATETLPDGRFYVVLNIETGAYADDTTAFTVPEGSYFFLGDNRDHSRDSRYSTAVRGIGMVPAALVVGRVGRVLFSSSGKGLWQVWTWRAGRFLRGVE